MSKIERDKYHVDIVTQLEAQEAPGNVYKLEKIIDVFQNTGETHPNRIGLGHTTIGVYDNPPTVGERFIIQGSKFTDYLNTSPVTEVVSETEFKTKNSTYSLTKVVS